MKPSSEVTSLQLDEDFARWRDDPITQLVFRALSVVADEQKAAWDVAAWGGAVVRGDDLERMLQELRVRADCYRALEALTVSDIKHWLGIDDAE